MIPSGRIKLCRRCQDPTTGTPDSRITVILLAYSQIHPSLSPVKIYNPMHYYSMLFRCVNKIMRRSNPAHNFQVLHLPKSFTTGSCRIDHGECTVELQTLLNKQGNLFSPSASTCSELPPPPLPLPQTYSLHHHMNSVASLQLHCS
jgi:hypothetical protein